MPLAFVTGFNTLQGTVKDDIVLGLFGLGDGPNDVDNVMNGNGGDDLMLGDIYIAQEVDDTDLNSSIGTAYDIDAEFNWSLNENPFVGNTLVPYTTVLTNATVGAAEYYSVTVGAGETITIDIDFGADADIGDAADLKVELLDAMGNVLASNDNGGFSAGGYGSDTNDDPYLNYLAEAGGTYYIRVSPADAATFSAPVSYMMNVSVTNHDNIGTHLPGDDIISGGDGNDTIAGQGGDDVLYGGFGSDFIIGGSGVDNIFGGDGSDLIFASGSTYEYTDNEENIHGGAGTDYIYSSGAGHYYGDEGNDFFFAGDTFLTAEIADGGDGVDTLFLPTFFGDYDINLTTGVTSLGNESFINFENVFTGNGNDLVNGTNAANLIDTRDGNDSITARGGNDTIDAGEGNNYINGGTGADLMIAGAGNDSYVVDNVGDVINDAGGTDFVRATFSYTLGAGLENLVLLTANDIDATGNELDNLLWGNSGNNVLNGMTGADIMRGGNGDDTYIVDNIGDRAFEGVGQTGFDTVSSSVNFVLWERVERLILNGTADLNGYGNSGDNVLVGNSGANILNGRAGADVINANDGDDRLFGEDGDDVLQGGAGSDWLEGGAGRDLMTGGSGLDQFVFYDGDFGNTVGTADRIIDFSHAEGDRIRLNLSDADSTVGGDQAYAFIGTTAFHGVAGELRYQQLNGNTYVYGDRDGDGAADWVVRLDGLHSLVAGDFIL